MTLEDYTPRWWKGKKIQRRLSVSGKKILLLEKDNGFEIEREGEKNLLAVDKEDNILWIAALPTAVYDSYYEIWMENGILFARSSNSHIAEIDPNTGEILKAYMVK